MVRFLMNGDWYRAVWRWHFYAGLFCLPFVIWLAATGAIYLFKPQVEAFIDRSTRGLEFDAVPGMPSEIAAAAVAAVPGSVLHRYVLPDDARDAVQVIVGSGARETRVYVHPASRKILKTADEEERFMRKIFLLHGELYAGRWGSTLVEIAASWTIVMLLTGLFLWWPRKGGKFAGTVYPRLTAGGRVFWRDLHAVIGLWVSVFAVFLIFSGLPWAKNWGGYLNFVREVTGTAGVRDWSTGSDEEAAQRVATDANLRAMLDSHAENHGMTMNHVHGSFAPLDAVVPAALGLRLAAPVEVSPPTAMGGAWLAQSNAGDRTVRETVHLDATGAVAGRDTFADRHWIDQAVGFGISVHEGYYFGLFNQFVSLFAALGLIVLAISAAVMWWRRRPQHVLGAPPPGRALNAGIVVAGPIAVLAVLLPSFGVTALVALMVEKTVLRGSRAGAWLGLTGKGAA